MPCDIKKIENFVKNKKVAILGLGVSNLPLLKMLSTMDCEIVVRDKNPISDENQIFLNSHNIQTITGENYLENLTEDIAFRSPGIMYSLPEIESAIKRGTIVTSEMELFFEVCPAHIIGITGSDGKTTTTTIISEILKEEGKKVYVGGNIGTPLLPLVCEMNEDDYAVVELSSFQTMSMKKSPEIAVITNIAPNHLDKHKDMDEYINSKTNIMKNGAKRVILNAENDITKSFITENSVTFSLFSEQKNGAYLKDGKIYFGDTFIMKKEDIKLPGIHNVDNYLAAICAVFEICSIESIKKVANNFGGVAHRIEFVRELNGVKYYNDSIASSPTRTIAGLNSFNQKVIMIAGGSDKGISFDNLALKIKEKVKALIVMGFTKDKIKNAVVSVDPDFPIYEARNLKDAVSHSHKIATDGDVVILSPACASFDFFKNFEDRGNQFKDMVNDL